MNLYIAVEGLDGVGKSTFVKNLEQAFSDHYRVPVRTIFEPGTTVAGKRLRELMKSGECGFSRYAELLLMTAARADLAEKELYPQFHGTIISDRCWLSTLAYQVTADPGLLGQFNATVDAISPGYPRGILFVIDGSVELVRTRAGVGDGRDAIEQASGDHWRRRQRLYSAVAAGEIEIGDGVTYPEEVEVLQAGISLSNHFFQRVIRIDARKTPEEQTMQAMKALSLHEPCNIYHLDSNESRVPNWRWGGR